MFPGAYAWSNFTILALGVWAVAQRDSIDAISMVSWGRTGLRVIVSPAPSSPSLVQSPLPSFFPIFHFLLSKPTQATSPRAPSLVWPASCLPGSASPESAHFFPKRSMAWAPTGVPDWPFPEGSGAHASNPPLGPS